MKSLTKLIALGVVAAASSSLSFATTVTPGGAVVAAAPVTVTNDGILATVTGSLTARTFTGSYTEYALYDGSNPFNGSCGATDCLTFLITVGNNATSPNGIEHVSDGDGPASFNNFLVNVGYAAGAGELGTQVPLSVDETIFGTIEFNFTGADAILPGSGTQYLVIQTNASNYTFGNLGVIDSSTDTETGLIPAASTPEPSSLVLLGTGLFGAASMVLRRRNTSSVL